jgi:cytoskeletal protein CcmA (bactofilin family)
MWRKEDNRPDPMDEPMRAPQASGPAPAPAPAPQAAPAPVSAPVPAAVQTPRGAERATIGRSIYLRGDVSGEEDLLIQGRVEGSVNLRQHSVTVGPDGEVMASIVGRVVMVEGRVEGNIDGGEQVILRSSAVVKGDIKAPRLVLENGARFRGLVDMGEEAGGSLSAAGVSRFEAGSTTAKGRTAPERPAAETNAGGKGTGTGSSSENGTAADEGRTISPSGNDAGTAAGGGAGKGRKGNDAQAQIAV